MAKSNLYAASNQWAVRPADERFWNVREARDACKAYAETAEEMTLDFGNEALMVGGEREPGPDARRREGEPGGDDDELGLRAVVPVGRGTGGLSAEVARPPGRVLHRHGAGSLLRRSRLT